MVSMCVCFDECVRVLMSECVCVCVLPWLPCVQPSLSCRGHGLGHTVRSTAGRGVDTGRGTHSMAGHVPHA